MEIAHKYVNDDVLLHIFSYLLDKEITNLICVNTTFSMLLIDRWRKIVQSSTALQRQRRNYYHKKSPILSIVYDSMEKAHLKKFVGFNAALGVQMYTVTQMGVNIFVRVRPCALGHVVGAVYTWTKWRDEHTSHGWWVTNTSDEEVWRINVPCPENGVILWFSVFVRDNVGRECWDSNNGWNYSVNLHDLPSTTYEQAHAAVTQYTEESLKYSALEYECEELWLNVDHVSCC